MRPVLELEWLIHYNCNFRCPYCFFEGMWEEIGARNIFIPTQRWIEAWERIRARYGHTRILITGGEPMLYPDFIGLVKQLSQNFSLGFDTNLSCAKEFLSDFVKQTNEENISLGLSFHPLFSNFDSFLEKALFLQQNGYAVVVQYVSYPGQINQMNDYRRKFETENLYFIPLPFRGQYQGKLYPASHTAKERKMIYSSFENLCAEHQDRVEGQLNQVNSKEKLCKAGQVYARVDNEGTVYRCGHLISSPDNKPLGNIFDKGFELLKQPSPCNQEVCPCEFRWLLKEHSEEKTQTKLA